MNREAVEAIVRTEFAHEPGADEIVRAIVDGAYREDDRDYIAADLWTMGAGVEHEGCVYGPPEPADADYENNCETCQAHLLGVADQIIAAMAGSSEPDGDEYDESSDACPACDTLPSKCHGGCCEDCNHASSWHAGMATGSNGQGPAGG